MTSYDHTPTFGLYFAVLKKSDASPLLPESDEDRGVGTGTRRPQPGACAGDAPGGEGGAAAVVKLVDNGDRVVRLQCRSILTDCNSESFPFRECRSGRTRICKRASMARCFSLKRALMLVALVAVRVVVAAVSFGVIVSAIVARILLSAT
jgi:hypothetical protein